jgi:hypothetical protein
VVGKYVKYQHEVGCMREGTIDRVSERYVWIDSDIKVRKDRVICEVPHKDGKLKYRVLVRFPTVVVNEETGRVKNQTENVRVRAYSKDGAKEEAGKVMDKMFPGKRWMIGGVYKDE